MAALHLRADAQTFRTLVLLAHSKWPTEKPPEFVRMSDWIGRAWRPVLLKINATLGVDVAKTAGCNRSTLPRDKLRPSSGS
jgi:hypothetical protein